MNWQCAVDAMKLGHSVVRASQQKRVLIGYSDGIPIFECGTESCRLAAAWTHDNKPVTVFQGAGSKALFIPDAEDLLGDDWEISP